MSPGITEIKKNCAISLVMPVYKPNIEYFKCALNSIKQQYRPPQEIIFVFDGFQDQTLENLILQTLPDSKIIHNIENLGQGSSRNNGLAHASYEWVAFLDQDDIWLPQHLEKICDVIESNPDVPYVHAAIGEMDNHSNITYTNINEIARMLLGIEPVKNNLLQALSKDMMVYPSSSVINKQKALTVGGFAPNLRGYEDDYLFLNLYAKFGENVFLNQTTAIWRKHENNTSYSSAMANSRFEYMQMLLRIFSYNHEYRRAICLRFVRNALSVLKNSKGSDDYKLNYAHYSEILNLANSVYKKIPLVYHIPKFCKNRTLFLTLLSLYSRLKWIFC